MISAEPTRPRVPYIYSKNHKECGAALNTCASEKDLALHVDSKENWGAEIRIYEEMFQRADRLSNAIEAAAESEKDKDLKAAILKRMETSFVAWAKDACESFYNDEDLPVSLRKEGSDPALQPLWPLIGLV